MLTALGFGPDTVLMNDPKLFVDGRFLASLLLELDDELGPADAALALFQIGLLHGLRDAARLCEPDEQHEMETSPIPVVPTSGTTSLVMEWRSGASMAPSGVLALSGSWPERHEATARCARLGSADRPTCWMSAGYTTGWLSGTLERSLVVREVECAATGAEACRFEVREASEWRQIQDETVGWLLARVPFEAFRKIAAAPAAERCEHPPAPDGATESRFDRAQPVVHIWGPVLILPFTTLDEALATVDMLGRDPGIREIRTVVIDLRDQPLDEGFGAAALEQILESVEAWNALSLITGVSPAAEAALAGLEASHLVLRKDLADAIASAFQIADAQRYPI
ncbi:MAG: 4-vinyl reductase [Deltaproteobacteria bacterium]|jgi:hypothetical protein|nr:4-vinyl reductase [Deltaproteobacteria bacterium]